MGFLSDIQGIGPSIGAVSELGGSVTPINPSVGTSSGTSTAVAPANQNAYNQFSTNYATMGNPNGPSTGALGPSYQDWTNAGSPADYQGYVNATTSPTGGTNSNGNFANIYDPTGALSQPSTPSGPSGPAGTGGLSSLVNSGTNPMATSTGTNPLSMIPTGTATGAVAPNLGVTAGSAPNAGGLTQGTALPNITTTQQQATATPQFYLDYLNQIAKQGGTAAQSAQYAGAQPLQEQAFSQVGQNVGNYQPTLQNAVNLASSVGNTSLADAIGNYGHANIAQNLAPQATAGIVGSGQFGSSRGAGALGQVLANADLGITQQQQQAMQQDMANKIAASQQLGSLATSTQNLGLGDVNALATLGGQQQTIAQNQQLFPMQQLTAESNLLKGATIPTATSSSYTGPIPGAYNTSPLAQIAGVGSVLAGTGLGQTLFGSPATGNNPATSGALGSLVNAASNWIGSAGGVTGSGIAMDSNGNPVSGSYPLADGGTLTINPDGSQSIKATDGTVMNFNDQGIPFTSATNSGNPPPVIDASVPIDPTTGTTDFSGTNWGGG